MRWIGQAEQSIRYWGDALWHVAPRGAAHLSRPCLAISESTRQKSSCSEFVHVTTRDPVTSWPIVTPITWRIEAQTTWRHVMWSIVTQTTWRPMVALTTWSKVAQTTWWHVIQWHKPCDRRTLYVRRFCQAWPMCLSTYTTKNEKKEVSRRLVEGFQSVACEARSASSRSWNAPFRCLPINEVCQEVCPLIRVGS